MILPQLGANGTRIRDIRSATGFSAEFGPIRAMDLPRYLDHGADDAMRMVTFTLKERAEVIPVEVVLGCMPLLWALLAALAASLVGADMSWAAIGGRWLLTASATGLGVLAGTVLFPLLLPWLPTRSFSLGGAALGLAAGMLLPTLHSEAKALSLVGAGLWTVALASWQALNFTGSTPYTAPSGVEKEMRRAIPLQAIGVLLAAVLFVWGNFQ